MHSETWFGLNEIAPPIGAGRIAPWRKLDDEKYNALSVARFDANAIWAAGPQGRIARLLRLPK